MSRENVIGDRNFGLGRRDDSSSSRESSPRRPQKRSFSPTSDDGDLVIPPIADDDTPPPPERPILRQAVAFAWDSSTSIAKAPVALNTYQASIPTNLTSAVPFFLPGQEVPTLPLSKTPRNKKGGGSTKKRRTTEYSSQTGRFRLQAYDPAASAEPPTHQGQGPYSSIYRATSSDIGHQHPGASSPTSTLMSYGSHSGDNGPITHSSPNPQTTIGQNKRSSGNKKSGQAGGRPKAKTKSTGTKAKSSGRGKASAPTNQPSPSSSYDAPPSSLIPSTNKYYRRDYDRDGYSLESPLTEREEVTRSGVHSALTDPQLLESLARNPPPVSPYPNPPGASYSHISDGSSGRRTPEHIKTRVGRVVRPLRIVTLLIQDLRSGTTDNQLAEIKIPLKEADNPEDGFWADAKELSEKLQASPSRIDGPAKVYTLRGKYRQFFLRVSADNIDEFFSANLAVKPDRVLDVVVETLLPPGKLPPPPQIPRNLRSPSPELIPVDHQYSPTKSHNVSPSFDIQGSSKRNRRFRSSTHSPARDISSYSATQSVESSPEPIPESSRLKKKGYAPHSGSPSTVNTLHKEDRGYSSPDSDDEPEEVHRLISKATDTIIQEDPGWVGFFRAKAAPPRASEVLKQYQFVQRMMDKWVGKRAPFKSFHVIEPSHITQALHIDDPKYSSNCTETLTLLALYGPNGQHCEDPRVIDMLNDESIPEYNAKPIKRLLHLLREIDETWKKKRDTSSANS